MKQRRKIAATKENGKWGETVVSIRDNGNRRKARGFYNLDISAARWWKQLTASLRRPQRALKRSTNSTILI